MLLENKVAIVTGGARGIGHAIARRFLDEGARVVIADIDEDAGAKAVRNSAPTARCASSPATSASGSTSTISWRRQSTPSAASTCWSTTPRILVTARLPRSRRGRFRPGDPHQSQGRLPVRPGGGPPYGRACRRGRGAGRDRQHVLGQRRLRDRRPGALFGVEGRHQPAHQGDGAVAGAARHPRQRHRAGLDHDRHAGNGHGRCRRRAGASCRARRSAASASRARSPPIAAFLVSDDASYITGQTIYADGGRLPLNYTVPVKAQDKS